MKMEIRKAERRKAKLRIGLSGPSGSGKTYSALLLARGLVDSWDKVLLIDTENGSGEMYSDLGPYNVMTLVAPFTPERYIEAIDAGIEGGMEVIIIDSVSHEWDGSGGCLEINEKLAQAKFKGNTWAAWSDTTPRHRRFIDRIVNANCHIITTVRNKTDTIQTEDKKVKKVGLKEIQRDGFEYELTANFSIDRDGHLAIASKDRTSIFSERDPFIINQEVGEELRAWTDTGKEIPVDVNGEKTKIMHNIKTRLRFTLPADKDMAGVMIKDIVFALTDMDLSIDNNLPKIVEKLEMIKDAEDAAFAWSQYQEQKAGVSPSPAPEGEAQDTQTVEPVIQVAE